MTCSAKWARHAPPTLAGGHDFSFTGVGGTLDVAGEAVGVIRITPDLLNPTGYYYLAQLQLTMID